MSDDDAKPDERRQNGEATGTGVSTKKLEANRRNALHSTGPKTPEGKQAVSRNALRHGLCSKEVVIRSGQGREDPKEYETLRAELFEDYQPVGFRERKLVEYIVNYHCG